VKRRKGTPYAVYGVEKKGVCTVAVLMRDVR
jgi:hypothetical protein